MAHGVHPDGTSDNVGERFAGDGKHRSGADTWGGTRALAERTRCYWPSTVVDLHSPVASIGPPEIDLGWWIMMDEFYSYGLGVPPLPGVPNEARQIARWEELMDRPAVNPEYFKRLAALRFAIVAVRSMDLAEENGKIPRGGQPQIRNPVAQLLSRYMGEPDSGQSEEFKASHMAYAGERDV